eukprot:SAG11_NODE_176_length_13359_cov_10.862142_12_plen_107_part_00
MFFASSQCARVINRLKIAPHLCRREFKVDAAAQMIAARAEWVSSLDGGAGLSMLLEEWRGSGSTPRARAARRFFYAALGGTTRTVRGTPCDLTAVHLSVLDFATRR